MIKNFNGDLNIGAVETRLGWVGLLWRGDALVANSFFATTIVDALTEIERRAGVGRDEKKPPKWAADFFACYAERKFGRSTKILAEKALFDFAGASAFRQSVWSELVRIPVGETRTYGDIARALANAARAVGGACGANPCPIIVPCHRVIGADGSLRGFGGGLDVKRMLLEHEGAM
jgi:O-6-methylguanine DNA methyltransferase